MLHEITADTEFDKTSTFVNTDKWKAEICPVETLIGFLKLSLDKQKKLNE